MPKTRRTYYLDDETIAFIQDLRNRGLVSNKSQGVRRALKTAMDVVREEGPDALTPDQTRRYEEIESGEEEGDSVGMDSGEGDGSGDSRDRRTVPNRSGGDGAPSHVEGDDVATPDAEEVRGNGHNASLSRFNPFG